MSCAGSFGHEEEAWEAEQTLREITPRAAVDIAYLAEGGHEFPVAHVAAEDWDCSELVELGNWAREALQTVDEDEIVTVVDSDDGPAMRRVSRAGASPLRSVRELRRARQLT